ncbi:NAC domain-containing protein 55-like isoform X1 [Curcuma longa]|uniref:NAC domain-containing protein 55-like isoform X1 n=2 Tax=Curcuma longa TaxID=136217 RepID=UPI003D9DCCA1
MVSNISSMFMDNSDYKVQKLDAMLPPGFRFHPTDAELVGYYLKRKVDGLNIELEVIPVIDLYKFDPWELPEKSFLPKRDMEWFFFCPRDRKYPNGSRTNRATVSGYWKATGKDRKIECERAVFGLRKTLVFYVGRAPGGERTDWIMHEYRLCEDLFHGSSNFLGAFALCHVVKRNANWLKSGDLNGEPKAQRNLLSSSSRKRDYDNLLNRTEESLSLELLNGGSGSSTITSPESVELHPSLPQITEMGIISDAPKTTSVPLEMNRTEEAYKMLSPFPSPVHCMEMYNSWEDITFQGWNSTEFIDISCSGGDVFSVMRSPPICRQASEGEEVNLWLQEDTTVVSVM